MASKHYRLNDLMLRRPLNPITCELIFLLAAQSFNDWFSLNIGAPTPIQIVLVASILFNLQYSGSVPGVIGVKNLLILYSVIVFIYTLSAGMTWGGVSILINLIWLIASWPLLVRGFSTHDWYVLKNSFFLIVVLVTIPAGFYELYSNKHILETEYGLLEKVFYIRGLHIDKLEFGTFLGFSFFLSLSGVLDLREKGITKSIFLFTILLSSAVLILSSFSLTSIFGTVSGAVGLLLISRRYLFLLILFLGVAPVLVAQFQKSETYEAQERAYELKYDQSVTNIEESNFRYLAFKTGWEAFLEKPVLGYGIGNSGEVIKDRLRLAKNINPHNFLINELLDFGLIGAVPFLLLCLHVTRLAWISIPQEWKTGSHVMEMRNVLVGLTLFMIIRLFLYYHRFDQTFYLVWFSLAIITFSTYRRILRFENFGLRQEIR